MKRLRVGGITVQMHTIWDDGETLRAGPDLAPLDLTYPELVEYVAAFPDDFKALAAEAERRANEGDDTEPSA